MDIIELQERRHALIKVREQLMANIHTTNGAIAELDRLIDLLVRANEGEKVCQDMVENPVEKPEIKRKIAKRAEKESSGQ